MARDTSIFAHGAVIVPDIVTPAEEARILLRISQTPWLTELRRRVQHFGYRYSYSGDGSREPAPAFPRWADNVLVDHMLRSARHPPASAERPGITATLLSGLQRVQKGHQALFLLPRSVRPRLGGIA